MAPCTQAVLELVGPLVLVSTEFGPLCPPGKLLAAPYL